MKIILTFGLTCLFYVTIHGQQDSAVRKYFFNQIDFVANGWELVILTRYPRTELARQIGNRIYSDTTTLSYIRENFYKTVRKGDPVLSHSCGQDLYFYIRKGEELVYYNCTNSQCSISDLGSEQRDMCSNLEYLAENGTPLVADTISRLPTAIRTREELRQAYFDDIVYSEPYLGNGSYWDYDKRSSHRNEHLYYDGLIRYKTSFDFDKTDDQYLLEALTALGLPVEFPGQEVEWEINETVLPEVWITFYFTDKASSFFDHTDCMAVPFPSTGRMLRPPLLIWRLPCK
jgi:hypothetical protein